MFISIVISAVFLVMVNRSLAQCIWNLDIDWCDMTFFSNNHTVDEAECICSATGRRLLQPMINSRLTDFLDVVQIKLPMLNWPVWVNRGLTTGMCDAVTFDPSTNSYAIDQHNCELKMPFLCELVPGNFTCFHEEVRNQFANMESSTCSEYGHVCLTSPECVGVWKDCTQGSLEDCKIIKSFSDLLYYDMTVHILDNAVTILDERENTESLYICPDTTSSQIQPSSTTDNPDTSMNILLTTAEHVLESSMIIAASSVDTLLASSPQAASSLDSSVVTDILFQTTFTSETTIQTTIPVGTSDIFLSDTTNIPTMSSTLASDYASITTELSSSSSIEEELCDCPCALYRILSQNKTPLTTNEAMEKASSLNAKLKATINVKDISSYINTKISAEDNRTSARSIGYLGIVLLSAIFGAVIVLDLPLLLNHFKLMFRNITNNNNH